MSDETKCPTCKGAVCNHTTAYIDKTHNRLVTYKPDHSAHCPVCLQKSLYLSEQQLAVAVEALKNIRGGCACQGICHCASVEAAEALKKIGATA